MANRPRGTALEKDYSKKGHSRELNFWWSRHAGAASGESVEHNPLYFRYSAAPRKSNPVSLTFIPYYASANRTVTPMQVWTPIAKT